MPISPKGKLYARMVHAGSRIWQEGVPAEYRQDCYDSYTDFYQYKPDIEPPKSKK